MQGHTKELENISKYGRNFLLMHLDCTKYDEMNIHFCHGEKHASNKILYIILKLSTGPRKRIRFWFYY